MEKTFNKLYDLCLSVDADHRVSVENFEDDRLELLMKLGEEIRLAQKDLDEFQNMPI